MRVGYYREHTESGQLLSCRLWNCCSLSVLHFEYSCLQWFLTLRV
uniref:Uncharacterized protein n=1 Tax=Rhizophora mucronata TaxID=61149 RepID=A0A2P2QIN2_RHIMU